MLSGFLLEDYSDRAAGGLSARERPSHIFQKSLLPRARNEKETDVGLNGRALMCAAAPKAVGPLLEAPSG